MDEKMRDVKEYLLKNITAEAVIYEMLSARMHKFAVRKPKVTHWLYIDNGLTQDKSSAQLISLLNSYSVVSTLNSATVSERLYLDKDGILRKVDESFEDRGTPVR